MCMFIHEYGLNKIFQDLLYFQVHLHHLYDTIVVYTMFDIAYKLYLSSF